MTPSTTSSIEAKSDPKEELLKAAAKNFKIGIYQFHVGGGNGQNIALKGDRLKWARPQWRSPFINAHARGEGQQWQQQQYPQLPAAEVEHRLERHGLTPCITGDAWVLTQGGPRQIRDLVGIPHQTIVDGYPYRTTGAGFFSKGRRQVVLLATAEGFSLKLTADHKVRKLRHRNPLGKPYDDWVPIEALQPGDKLLLNNHRGVEPWPGPGTIEGGYQLGQTIARNHDQQFEVAIAPTDAIADRGSGPPADDGDSFDGEIEKGSYSFYGNFLKGVFDTAGRLDTETSQLELYLPDTTGGLLARLQRMLARLGIIARRSGLTLAIAGDNLSIFYAEIGSRLPERAEALRQISNPFNDELDPEPFIVTVASTDFCGEEEVFDCTVEAVHRFCANGFVVSNCGEIVGSTDRCNLGDLVAAAGRPRSRVGLLRSPGPQASESLHDRANLPESPLELPKNAEILAFSQHHQLPSNP